MKVISKMIKDPERVPIKRKKNITLATGTMIFAQALAQLLLKRVVKRRHTLETLKTTKKVEMAHTLTKMAISTSGNGEMTIAIALGH